MFCGVMVAQLVLVQLVIVRIGAKQQGGPLGNTTKVLLESIQIGCKQREYE